MTLHVSCERLPLRRRDPSLGRRARVGVERPRHRRRRATTARRRRLERLRLAGRRRRCRSATTGAAASTSSPSRRTTRPPTAQSDTPASSSAPAGSRRERCWCSPRTRTTRTTVGAARACTPGGSRVSFARPFGRGMLMRPSTERDDRKSRPTYRRRGARRRRLDLPALPIRQRLSRGSWARRDGSRTSAASSSGPRHRASNSTTRCRATSRRDPDTVAGYDL